MKKLLILGMLIGSLGFSMHHHKSKPERPPQLQTPYCMTQKGRDELTGKIITDYKSKGQILRVFIDDTTVHINVLYPNGLTRYDHVKYCDIK